MPLKYVGWLNIAIFCNECLSTFNKNHYYFFSVMHKAFRRFNLWKMHKVVCLIGKFLFGNNYQNIDNEQLSVGLVQLD